MTVSLRDKISAIQMYRCPCKATGILGSVSGVQVDTPKQKFKRYEIIEELGIGGMATVYRAYDPLFEREVALKVLKRELLEDPELKERFERETKIVAKLEHAAIVPVYDVGHDNGQLFYVMRYMSGGSLSDRINNGTLDLDQVAYLLLRLADALDYAHRKGIVHRDLKPGNILFDEVGNAFISDFGIAKFAQAATRITHSGIIGTPRYMSPEQARGEETDGRSDLYTLGVLLYEILSGKAPFEATTPSRIGVQACHRTRPGYPDGQPPPAAGTRARPEKNPAKETRASLRHLCRIRQRLPRSPARRCGSQCKTHHAAPAARPEKARDTNTGSLPAGTSPEVQEERLDDRRTRRDHPPGFWFVGDARTAIHDGRFHLHAGNCHRHKCPSLLDAFSHSFGYH
jgi:serine/threonine protein kinase